MSASPQHLSQHCTVSFYIHNEEPWVALASSLGRCWLFLIDIAQWDGRGRGECWVRWSVICFFVGWMMAGWQILLSSLIDLKKKKRNGRCCLIKIDFTLTAINEAERSRKVTIKVTWKNKPVLNRRSGTDSHFLTLQREQREDERLSSLVLSQIWLGISPGQLLDIKASLKWRNGVMSLPDNVLMHSYAIHSFSTTVLL